MYKVTQMDTMKWCNIYGRKGGIGNEKGEVRGKEKGKGGKGI